MVELAREGIFIVDPQANFTFANHFFAQALDLTPEDLQGRSLFNFLSPEGREVVNAQLERRRQGKTDTYELTLVKPDGSLLPSLISATPLMVEGNFIGSLAIVTDISQLKAVEGEIRSAKEFYETIINSITDNLVVIDPRTYALVLANASFLAYTGKSPDQVLGRPCYAVIRGRTTPCIKDGLHCPAREGARLKRMILSERPLINFRGENRTFQVATFPHLDPQGNVDLLIRLERDVTDRRQMEETLAFRSRQLQKTQRQLARLAEIARERTGPRSFPDLVHFLQDRILETFPFSDPIFLILDPRQDQFLSLKDCSPHATEALSRLLLHLEQSQQVAPFCQYLRHLEDPNGVTSADHENLPPFFQPLWEIYPSWCGLPLFAQQHCLGFFVLGFHMPQAFSGEDLHFLQALFAQVVCYLRYLLRREEVTGAEGRPPAPKTSFGDLIGQSKEMQELYRFIDQVGGTDAPVLILGESGTGKELAARTLHRHSKRSREPFLTVACSASSPTLLESELFGHEKGAFTGAIRRHKGALERAHGGTLFLDEVADLPPATQIQLLRFLQDRIFERVGGDTTLEVNVRVVAATAKDLHLEVQAGRFREDLYYRLHITGIHLPPLRKRREDIPLLCQHFLHRLSLREGKRLTRFSSSALQVLMDFDWPGNVRQLENVISHAVTLASGEVVRRHHLPRFLQGEDAAEAPPASLADAERQVIIRALKESGWNKHEAARRLKVSRSTLYSKIKRYGLQEFLRGAVD